MVVDLGLTEEQAAVEELFAGFFGRECSTEVVRRSEELGFSPEVWARLRETGALSLAVGEEHGGAGAGLLELAVVAEQYGRHLAPVPLIDHAVTLRLLERVRAAGGQVDGDAWDAALEGSEIAALAVRPLAGDTARLVPAGSVARFIAAFDPTGGQLVLLEGTAPKVPLPNLAALPLADRGPSAGDAVTVLLDGEGARELYDAAVDEWRILTAAALVGLSEGALAIAVDYVKTRHQFDVPIGSFQAIQHGLAELPGKIAGARLLAARAAWGVDGGRTDDPAATDRPRQAAMALLFAGELASLVTSRAVHYHGGYGVMEEQDIQLFYRRAKGWPQVLADPAREYQHLAGIVLGPVEAR